MSEELKINIKVDPDDSGAKQKLDSLIQKYNEESIELKVKIGNVDTSEIRSSLVRLTSDLNKISGMEFDGLEKLETNLKKINKLIAEQNKGSVSSGENIIPKSYGKASLEEVKELANIGSELEVTMKAYKENTAKAKKDFDEANKELFEEMNIHKNSSSSTAFKRIISYKQKLQELQDEMNELGVKPLGMQTNTYEDSRNETKTHSHNGGYMDMLGQTEKRFEEACEQARKLAPKISSKKKQIEDWLQKASDEERQIIDKIDSLQEKIKPMHENDFENPYLKDLMRQMLKEYSSIEDLDGLDLTFDNDIFKAYERFFERLEKLKLDYREAFKDDANVEVSPFGNIEANVKELESTVKSIDLTNLREGLTKAFDIDDKILANIEKIENALKQLNSMSKLTQESLFNGEMKSLGDVKLDDDIRKYLELDKQINDAFVKLSKSQLNNTEATSNAIEQEIMLLMKKQDILRKDVDGNENMSLKLREQINLQEQLNKAISETQKTEYKESYLSKLHKEAIEVNNEMDRVQKTQKMIADFDVNDFAGGLDTENMKSYVHYLDSAEDGLKSIITYYSKLKGVDLTVTTYGDGTQYGKVTGNLDKAVNELATAYKQADTELTRLIKSQQQFNQAGDVNSANLLNSHVEHWKEVKSEVERAAKGVKVYNEVLEKSRDTLVKNQQTLGTNESRLEFRVDVDNQKAVQKLEEFKTKTLSNLQELERKYEGTQLSDGIAREIEKIKSELRELDNYLENVEHADLSKLSSEFRRIGQNVTQLNRDMKALDKSISNDFFDDLYDSMRTFTLGEIIGDAITGSVSQIKDAVVGLDNAFRDMMKVAPEGFNGTADQLRDIKYEALEVAKSVGQSTEDVIQGMSKALQMGVKNMSDALEVAKGSSMFANVGDLSQSDADTYMASIISSFYGMENALKPVRNQVQGMGQDYNNLTNILDLANYAG